VSNTKKKGKNQAKPTFPFAKKKKLNNNHRQNKEDARPIYSRSGRRVLSLSLEFLVGLSTYLGILGFAAIPTILMRDVQINTAQFASYNAVFAIVLLLVSLPSGLLARKYGSTQIVMLGISIVAISDFAFGFSPNYSLQIISRIALGTGACFWWICAPENVVKAFGKENSAFPLSMWLCGYLSGAAISYPLTVWWTEAIGWRITYELYGVMEGLLAISYFFFFFFRGVSERETCSIVKEPEEKGTMDVTKISSIASSSSYPQPINRAANIRAPISKKIKNFVLESLPKERVIWIISVAMLFQYYFWIGVLTFFPLYLVSSGFSLFYSSLLGFALVMIGVPATLLAGFVSFKIKRTVPLLTVGLVLGMCVFLLPYAVTLSRIFPYLLFLLIAAMGISLALPDTAWTFLSEVLSVPGSGSMGFAVANTFGFVGSILGTYIPPMILESSGWAAVWNIYGAVLILCLVFVVLFLWKAEKLWFAQASS
jgi:sugar phosphate permease